MKSRLQMIFANAIPLILIVLAISVAYSIWLEKLPPISPKDLPTKPRTLILKSKTIVLPEGTMYQGAAKRIANFVWKNRDSEQYHLAVKIEWNGNYFMIGTFLVDRDKINLAKQFETEEKHRCDGHVQAIYEEVIDKIDRHDWLSDPNAMGEMFRGCYDKNNTD